MSLNVFKNLNASRMGSSLVQLVSFVISSASVSCLGCKSRLLSLILASNCCQRIGTLALVTLWSWFTSKWRATWISSTASGLNMIWLLSSNRGEFCRGKWNCNLVEIIYETNLHLSQSLPIVQQIRDPHKLFNIGMYLLSCMDSVSWHFHFSSLLSHPLAS